MIIAGAPLAIEASKSAAGVKYIFTEYTVHWRS
jgi:hypothetical protein